MKRAVALGLALAAGCTDTVTVRPVIDTPVIEAPEGGGSGTVFGVIDTIELSIALDGELGSLQTVSFRRGETLELSDVPYGENLVVHMVGKVNDSEVAYGRTCQFSVRAGEDPPEPRLYFARTVRWAPSATPPSAVRIGGTAHSSRSGSALYLGGVDSGGATVVGADRFDPNRGEFDQLATLTPRVDGAAANLGDGRVVVVGGVDRDGAVAEVIDVVSIDAAPDAAVDRVNALLLATTRAPALATLSDGRVVAVGGADRFGMTLSSLTEIDGTGGGATISTLPRAVLTHARYGHTVTRLSDDLGAPLLVAGGRDGSGAPVANAELFRPLFGEVAPAAEFARPMQQPRWDHAAVRLPDGNVLIIGGRNATGPVPSLELFKLETGFIVQGFLTEGFGVTDFSVTTLPDGRVLIAGGRDSMGRPVAAAYIVRIDPVDGSVRIVATDPLSEPRAGHEATLLCDGTVMLVGGTGEPSRAERYNPPSAGRR